MMCFAPPPPSLVTAAYLCERLALFCACCVPYVLTSLALITLACEWDLQVFRAVRLQQCFIGHCYFRNPIR